MLIDPEKPVQLPFLGEELSIRCGIQMADSGKLKKGKSFVFSFSWQFFLEIDIDLASPCLRGTFSIYGEVGPNTLRVKKFYFVSEIAKVQGI